VEDLLAERGLDISHETVRRWFLNFGAPIARNLRRMRPTPFKVTTPFSDKSYFSTVSGGEGMVGPEGSHLALLF
jgi:hypothetical protein